MQNRRKQVLPLLFIFIFINAILLTSPSFFDRLGIDRDVLIAANAILFLIHFITFLLQSRAIGKTNPHVFVRSMMAGLLIKMFVVIAALLGYILIKDKEVNKPAIYISIGLYFIYLAVEVAIVMKLNKQKNA